MTIIEEAAKIVAGDRAKDYGDVAGNWQCIAELWSAYLTRRLNLPVILEAGDVAMLNVLQKAARQAYRPKRDNLTDIIGYCSCADSLGHKGEFPEPLHTR